MYLQSCLKNVLHFLFDIMLTLHNEWLVWAGTDTIIHIKGVQNVLCFCISNWILKNLSCFQMFININFYYVKILCHNYLNSVSLNFRYIFSVELCFVYKDKQWNGFAATDQNIKLPLKFMRCLYFKRL